MRAQKTRFPARRNTLRRRSRAASTGAFPTTSFEIRQLRWRDAASICTRRTKPAKSIGVLTGSRGRLHRRWTGPAARLGVLPDAPIGAVVFATERRNHCRTTVYGDLCARDPVDTFTAADRLQKSKKSFKFDRFDDCVRLGIRLGVRPAERRTPHLTAHAGHGEHGRTRQERERGRNVRPSDHFE